MSAVDVSATGSSSGGLGLGTLLLSLVVGLLGFALLLLLIMLSDHRGRQLLVAARAVWTLGLASIRERRVPESTVRAETRRRLADALQDLRSVLGDELTARQLAEVAAWEEHVAREDARTRERGRTAREQARERAAARVAMTLRRAQDQAAVARAARESLTQQEAGISELPAAEAQRLEAAIEAATTRLLSAQQAAAAAEDRAAVEIAAAEQAAAARVAVEQAADKAAAVREAAERVVAEEAAAERVAAEQAASAERVAAEEAAAERVAVEQAAAEKAAAEREAAARVAEEKTAAERAAAERETVALVERVTLTAVGPAAEEIDIRETARHGAATGRRSGRPAAVAHVGPRRIATSPVREPGPLVLVPSVEEPAVPRPPVSWQLARGAPLVETSGRSYRRRNEVDGTRRRLIELRQNDVRSIRRMARQVTAVRAALLALAPAVVIWRILTDSGFLSDVRAGGTGLRAALALAVIGSALAWRVSSPAIVVLGRPSAKSDTHLLRSLLASEQLALRLASGATPSDAWRSVALGNRFPASSVVPAGTAAGALALAEQSRRTILRRRRDLVRRRVAVTVLPVLVFVLPAALLLAVL